MLKTSAVGINFPLPKGHLHELSIFLLSSKRDWEPGARTWLSWCELVNCPATPVCYNGSYYNHLRVSCRCPLSRAAVALAMHKCTLLNQEIGSPGWILTRSWKTDQANLNDPPFIRKLDYHRKWMLQRWLFNETPLFVKCHSFCVHVSVVPHPHTSPSSSPVEHLSWAETGTGKG